MMCPEYLVPTLLIWRSHTIRLDIKHALTTSNLEISRQSYILDKATEEAYALIDD